jgi:hypothetical protein
LADVNKKRPVELRPNAPTDFDQIWHISRTRGGLYDGLISSKTLFTISRFSAKTQKRPLAWRPNAPIDFDEQWPPASPHRALIGALISSKTNFTVSRIQAAKFFFRFFYRSLRPNGATQKSRRGLIGRTPTTSILQP